MKNYGRPYWFLAIAIAALAGFVDAIGFIELGGFFLSFMSGNSTRFAVGLADNGANAATAGLLIASFVIGVVAGQLVSRAADRNRKPVVLLFVSGLLAFSALLQSVTSTTWSIWPLATAMGALNSVFQRDGEVSIGVTYMTGALVKMGQRIAGAMLGEGKTDWLPYALLWAGLTVGAVLGALTYAQLQLWSIWIAVCYSALLAAVAYGVTRAKREG